MSAHRRQPRCPSESTSMGAQCIKKLPFSCLPVSTSGITVPVHPEGSVHLSFCFCGCCNSASARRVRIFCIRWSRSALICAHSLSSCARRSVSSAGTFFFVPHFVLQTRPEIHGNGAKLYFNFHFPFLILQKNRYCNDQMQAAVRFPSDA